MELVHHHSLLLYERPVLYRELVALEDAEELQRLPGLASPCPVLQLVREFLVELRVEPPLQVRLQQERPGEPPPPVRRVQQRQSRQFAAGVHPKWVDELLSVPIVLPRRLV